MRRAMGVGLVLSASCGRIAFDPVVDAESDAFPINPAACPALPIMGTPIVVTTTTELAAAVATAVPGTTVLLADGVYQLTAPLDLAVPLLTVRSQSGNASRVVLDGGATISPLVRITASGATLSSITLRRSADEGVFVEPGGTTDVTNTTIYDVTLVDTVGPRIRLRPGGGAITGPFADSGTIACSRFIATGAVCNAGVFGINADAVRGWAVLDNVFDRRACTSPGFRTVWFMRGSRDTQIINNVFLAQSFNLMLGGSQVTPRTYIDAPPATCAGGTPDHWNGLVCNNVIAAPVVPAAAAYDFNEGIALWNACEDWVMHNTIISPNEAETLGSIEFRFTGTYVHLVNNLLLEAPTMREGGLEDTAFSTSNAMYSALTDFVDPANGNARLSTTATLPAGASIQAFATCDRDADGTLRNLAAPTVGAYER